MPVTRETLERRLDLIRRLREYQAQRDALTAAAEPGAQVLTGLPHATGYRDRLGGLVAEIADIDTEIERIRAELSENEPEIVTFLAGIQEIRTQYTFRLRFLYGFTWAEIAGCMGDNPTTGAAQGRVRRYLKEHAAKD